MMKMISILVCNEIEKFVVSNIAVIGITQLDTVPVDKSWTLVSARSAIFVFSVVHLISTSTSDCILHTSIWHPIGNEFRETSCLLTNSRTRWITFGQILCVAFVLLELYNSHLLQIGSETVWVGHWWNCKAEPNAKQSGSPLPSWTPKWSYEYLHVEHLKVPFSILSNTFL